MLPLVNVVDSYTSNSSDVSGKLERDLSSGWELLESVTINLSQCPSHRADINEGAYDVVPYQTLSAAMFSECAAETFRTTNWEEQTSGKVNSER